MVFRQFWDNFRTSGSPTAWAGSFAGAILVLLFPSGARPRGAAAAGPPAAGGAAAAGQRW